MKIMPKLNGYCCFCANEKHLDYLIDLDVHKGILNDVLTEMNCFSNDYLIFNAGKTMKLKYMCHVCRNSLKNAFSFFQNVCRSFSVLTECNILSADLIKDEDLLIEHTAGRVKDEKIRDPGDQIKQENLPSQDTNDDLRLMLNNDAQTFPEISIFHEELSWSNYPWVCGLCSDEQTTLDQLRKHCVQTHNICFAAKCRDCLRITLNFSAFVAHVVQHSEKLKLYCRFCNYVSPNTEEAVWHTKLHNNTKPTCYKCGTPLDNNDISEFCVDVGKLTWSHVEWFCSNCPLTFHTQDRLRKHCIEKHKTCFTVICMECEAKFDAYSNYVEHLRTHLPILKQYCHICNINLGEMMNEDDHIFEAHLTNSRKPCKKCGTLVKRNKLTTHYKKCNNLPILPRKKACEVTEDDLTCNICKKVSKNKICFRAHVKIHNKNRKKIYCDQCGKDFFTDSAYFNHNKSIHGKKEFSCAICNKQFALLDNLKRHSVTHTQERPFLCDICSKAFKSKRCIREHIESVHLKEKKHQCKVCSKTFVKLYGLKLHFVQHTGEKPYACSECDRVFSNYSNCYKHLKTRHGKTSVITLFKKSLPDSSKLAARDNAQAPNSTTVSNTE